MCFLQRCIRLLLAGYDRLNVRTQRREGFLMYLAVDWSTNRGCFCRHIESVQRYLRQSCRFYWSSRRTAVGGSDFLDGIRRCQMLKQCHYSILLSWIVV